MLRHFSCLAYAAPIPYQSRRVSVLPWAHVRKP